ncbi:MAG: insulinase family protein [Desulfovibrio sp.]|jgi:zinc protease|nr:insulinase family protein [Desulfovibrio sp.]
MRFFILFLTGCIAMTANMHLSSASVYESGNAAAGEGTITRRLANGLTVLIKRDTRFPLVSLRLYVHAGSAYEAPEQAGISHMLEHMVFKGTKKRPKGSVAQDVEKTGGYLNASTSFDSTVYLTDMTSDQWETGLDALKDMAFHPTLNPADLEAEQEVVIAELKRGEDSPGQRLFRMIQKAVLNGTPYANPIIGYEKTVRALSDGDLRAYIERLYQPQSMLLLICGDIVPEDALHATESLFGDMKNTRAVTPPAPMIPPARAGFTAEVETGPWQKVHLALALPAPGMDDARAAQLDVLAHLLGGDASSRFPRLYHYEKRLVDEISVVNYSFERLGMIFIQASLDADKLPAFWEAFSKELAALSSVNFSPEELNRAKLTIEDGLFRSKETLSGYASKLGYFAFFGKGEQDENNYLNTVRDTDQRILADLVKNVFRPEAVSMAVLLPEGRQAPQTSATGETKGNATMADAKGNNDDAEKSPAKAWSDWFGASFSAGRQRPAPDKGRAARAGNSGGMEIINIGQDRTLILLYDATLPYVAATMDFFGGDSLLSEKKNQGLAAFTASLLTKGTKKLSATALEDFLADRAASFSAASGKQSFSISMNSPARFSADMFDLLQATLVTPAMKDEEAARVSENQIAAITAREDQPVGLAFRRMFPFLFGEHSYGFLQLGEKERVAAFTAKDAMGFWKEQTLSPWTLAVCGAYDREEILAAVKKLPVPAKKEQRPDAPQWGKEKKLELALPGRNQTHLFMVFPTMGQGGDDEAGLELLENILAGQSGLLFKDLRDEQSLGYSVTAFSWKNEKAGALIFYIGTEADKLAQAKAGFAAVISKLHNDLLPAADIERGKNQMRGDYHRRSQSLGSRSSEAAALALMKLPLDHNRALVEKARNIEAQTLRQLARAYIQPEKAYTITVLP